MSKRMLGWGLSACLLIGGCGGGGDLGEASADTAEGRATPPPDGVVAPPAVPTTVGTWVEPIPAGAPTTLAVVADGSAYGLLHSNSGYEVVRGRLPASDGLVPASAFDAVGLGAGSPRRQIQLTGSVQPAALLRLRLVPDDGTAFVLPYEARYDRATSLADLSGDYNADLAAAGSGDVAVFTVDGPTVRMTSTTPGRGACQANGTLSTPSQAPLSRMDLVLVFSGDGCLLPAGTRIEGVALVDVHQITLLGMDEAGTVGLFVYATRP